jgi:surface polysaccharide O-acyltransferase-like enzyme
MQREDRAQSIWESAMANDATNATRYEFLDWLRVMAIFVLLFFHTGMLFVGWHWHIQNAETIPALAWPMDLAHRLRMPLLFVIAGSGLWFASKRRSRSALIGERTLRLLVPVVVGMFLIVPPQVFIERIAHGQWSGGYLDFMVQRVLRFEPYPTGDFSWHHLWFIVYLYVYALLLVPLLAWWRRTQPVLRPGVWIYALALPLGINEALLKPLFPESHNLIRDWYTFNHYLLLTIYGVVLASIPGTWDWLAARRRWSLAVGLAVITGLLLMFEAGVIAHDSVADFLLANVFTWLWLLVFLGYGRQYLSFGNRFLSWARDASYPVYILHQTVIIVIAYKVIQLPWRPWTKYWIVLGATLVTCVLVYQLLLRRFATLRIMFGIKRTAVATPPAPIAAASLIRFNPGSGPPGN